MSTPASAALRIVATGPLSLVQDAGRLGHAHVGVSPSGAADRGAYALANRLLGNPETAAAIEVLLGGLVVETIGRGLWLCVTGSPCPVAIDGRGVGSHTAFFAPAGSTVELGSPASGLRSYLGVRGGVAVDPVMGSRSRDTLSGLGPAPLQEGHLLPVGASPEIGLAPVDVAPRRVRVDGAESVRVVRGPRDRWLADPQRLVTQRWVVSGRSDRVGLRLTALDGAGLERAAPDELPSEGVWRGAIQVPPSGDAVVFGPDHPVTGGYPVIGVVLDADLDRLAQLRPGTHVRFSWAGPARVP